MLQAAPCLAPSAILYQVSRNEDNGSGEVEANDTAFRTNFNADASLSRYNQTHRGAFSLFNNTNFGQPDSNISNVTAGVISSADDARSMQFGLRFVW